jgi:hypothetical protein
MNRTLLPLLLATILSSTALAQDAACREQSLRGSTAGNRPSESRWDYFHGFLFRRSAGSVEMETKTPYPKNYSGRYTYLPWSPDWVRTPENEIRASAYRHHQHYQATHVPSIAALPQSASRLETQPQAQTPLNSAVKPVPYEFHSLESGPLQEVEVQKLR